MNRNEELLRDVIGNDLMWELVDHVEQDRQRQAVSATLEDPDVETDDDEDENGDDDSKDDGDDEELEPDSIGDPPRPADPQQV